MPDARALAGLALVPLLLAPGPEPRAQSGVEQAPPARLPSGASLTAVDLSFPVVGASFASLPLSLPEAAVSAPTASGNVAGAAPGSPSPADRPSNASFGAVALDFPTAALSFGEAGVSFGTGAASLDGAATDLPGMSVRAEAGGYRFTLGADVLFDFDRYNLRPEAGPILRRLVERVEAELPGARWQVEGHTDAKGSDAYNDQLSDRRAASVRRWLTGQGGVSGSLIATVGYGERRPVAPNTRADGSDDPDGRQLNRRVEILVTPS